MIEATEIKTLLEKQRVFVEFQANDGRKLKGEIMPKGDAPDGHFAVVVNWSTWYVTPDVMLRFVTPKQAAASWK